jgi:putative ABC transport system substrate-binding protein
MTTRRQFLLAGALGALAAPRATAQVRVRIGILAGVPREKSVATPLLLERLAELGYREGITLAVDYRYSTKPDRYPALVRELIERKCNLVFSVGTRTAARALREAHASVPVVLIAVEYDPVETGIVESFARPGRNITGVYIPIAALAAKRVELAHEMLPATRHYLVLADRFSKTEVQGLQSAADARGLRLTVVDLAEPTHDMAAAFETGRKTGASGVLLVTSAEVVARRKEIFALIERHRLPAIVPDLLAGDPGILASYSVDGRKFARRAADMADRILKGARASEMPLEQPHEYSVVVNLRTAKTLGIAIPPSVLARATRVIE